MSLNRGEEIMEMKPEWVFLTTSIYDPITFWTMMSALATAAMTLATLGLLLTGILPLVRSRKAELAERFRVEFLSPEAQKIFFLVGHGLLLFETDTTTGIGFFRIIQASENIIEQRLRQILGEQRIVLTFEMDDKFLSPLQEIGYYEEHGDIDFEEAFRIFGDYVDVAVTNREIKKYLTWIREARGARGVFGSLEKLHAKMKAHDEKVRPKNSKKE